MKSDVQEILKEWLTANGYDGLFNEWSECGCEIDDLAPCDSCMLECRPGVKIPCPGECEFHDPEDKGAPECWHMASKEVRDAE